MSRRAVVGASCATAVALLAATVDARIQHARASPGAVFPLVAPTLLEFSERRREIGIPLRSADGAIEVQQIGVYSIAPGFDVAERAMPSLPGGESIAGLPRLQHWPPAMPVADSHRYAVGVIDALNVAATKPTGGLVLSALSTLQPLQLRRANTFTRLAADTTEMTRVLFTPTTTEPTAIPLANPSDRDGNGSALVLAYEPRTVAVTWNAQTHRPEGSPPDRVLVHEAIHGVNILSGSRIPLAVSVVLPGAQIDLRPELPAFLRVSDMTRRVAVEELFTHGFAAKQPGGGAGQEDAYFALVRDAMGAAGLAMPDGSARPQLTRAAAIAAGWAARADSPDERARIERIAADRRRIAERFPTERDYAREAGHLTKTGELIRSTLLPAHVVEADGRSAALMLLRLGAEVNLRDLDVADLRKPLASSRLESGTLMFDC